MTYQLVDDLLTTMRMPKMHVIFSTDKDAYLTACGRRISVVLGEVYGELDEDSEPCGRCRSVLRARGETFPGEE